MFANIYYSMEYLMLELFQEKKGNNIFIRLTKSVIVCELNILLENQLRELAEKKGG